MRYTIIGSTRDEETSKRLAAIDAWPGDHIVVLSPFMNCDRDRREYRCDSLGNLQEVG